MKNIEKLLDQFLKTLTDIGDKFEPNSDDVMKADVAIDFQSKIINILDYCYTNFPTSDKVNKKGFFPRPDLNEKKSDYLKRVSFLKKKEKSVKLSQKMINFLGRCFDINKKNNYAISLILSRTKHKKENEFGKKGETFLEAKFKTNYSRPIRKNTDGSVEIAGGLIRAEAGANLHFYGCKIETPDGYVDFEKLNFTGTKFEGNYIYLKDDEKRDFLNWSNDCKNICAQIINEFNKVF